MVAITDIFTKSRYHSGKCIPLTFRSGRFWGTFWSQFWNGLIFPEHVTPGMVILAGLSAILNSAGMTGFQQESVGHDKDLAYVQLTVSLTHFSSLLFLSHRETSLLSRSATSMMQNL